MSRYLNAAIISLCLITASVNLAACSTLGLPETSSPAVKGEQALFVMEQAWKGANITVQAAVTAGILRGENATKAAAIMANANTVMISARAANRVGQAVRSGDLFAILGQLQPLGISP